MRFGLLALALGAVLGLGACGGEEEPDTSTPEGTVNAFVAAYSERDYAAACELLDPKVNDIEFEAEFNDLVGTGNAECEESAEVMYDEADLADTLADLEEAQTSDVETDGKNATIDSADGDWDLFLVDGEWRISDVPFIEGTIP